MESPLLHVALEGGRQGWTDLSIDEPKLTSDIQNLLSQLDSSQRRHGAKGLQQGYDVPEQGLARVKL